MAACYCKLMSHMACIACVQEEEKEGVRLNGQLLKASIKYF